jgi:hypothetical protein
MVFKPGITSGLGSMLKMMGVDPIEVMKMAEAVKADVARIANELTAIREQNGRIEAKLDRVLGEGNGGTTRRAAAGH